MSVSSSVIRALTWQPEVGKPGSWQNIAAKVGFELATTGAMMMIPGVGTVGAVAKVGRLASLGLKATRAAKLTRYVRELTKLGKLRTARKSLSLASKQVSPTDILMFLESSQAEEEYLPEGGAIEVASKKGLIKAGKAAKKAAPKLMKVGKVQAGKKLATKVGKALPGLAGGAAMLAQSPVAVMAQELVSRGVPPSQAAQLAGVRRRRSRGMFLRKGKLYMGFSQSEVKNAMRRTYGRRGKK